MPKSFFVFKVVISCVILLLQQHIIIKTSEGQETDVETEAVSQWDPTENRLLYFASAVRGKYRKYSELDEAAFDAIKDSPFDSYSLYMDRTDYESLIPQINLIEKSEKKFWPRVVFPNDMISDTDTVLRLWDENSIELGLSYIRTALKVAKNTDAGGIFIDQEFYKNADNYMVSFVASENKKSVQETINSLNKLGAQVADCVYEEYGYENVTLWFTFADLFKVLSDGKGRTGNYFVEGILDRIIEKKYNIKVIDGGETTVWYVHLSVEVLEERMKKQAADQMEFVEKYEPFFELGGTTILFDNINSAGNWQEHVDSLPEEKKEIKTINQYVPLLKQLFAHYNHVWIYWGGEPIYDEFDEKSYSIFRPIVSEALNDVVATKKIMTPPQGFHVKPGIENE